MQLYLNGVLPHTFFLTLFVTIYIKPMETINRVAEIANSRELRILHKRKKMFYNGEYFLRLHINTERWLLQGKLAESTGRIRKCSNSVSQVSN